MVDNQPIMTAVCGSQDRPLTIGGIDIACYVLENDIRVITQHGILQALSLKYGGRGYTRAGAGERYLAGFVMGKKLRPYFESVNTNIVEEFRNPIPFVTGSNTRPILGYEATLLSDLCEGLLAARAAGVLSPSQRKIADRCEIMMRGFARVGIIALIDETTGYQEFREKDALRRVLDRFIDGVIHKWIKTFHDEFYVQLYRLRKMRYDPKSSRRPSYIGHLTNDLIYSRIVPGLKERLSECAVRDEKGNLKYRLHQHLTPDLGHPELEKHLHTVTTMMRSYDSWNSFYFRLDKALPRFGATYLLPFDLPDTDN